ncbi:MAG: AAA family ATPase [Pseudonocardia sp.]|nr:AAA family ATPase [Pseudonocardia sp.]
MSRFGCPVLVGRTDEWADLVAALDAARSGRGSLACVLGEAGIGKSRLAADLCALARDRGQAVLWGRAVDTGTPVTFRPLFEALSGYFRRDGDTARPELAGTRATLAQLVPEWRRDGEQPYRASPMELGEALLRLLSSIADTRGCVLVLEDLQWADLDTVAVLEYIGDNIGSVPVLGVATVRSDATTPALRVVRELAARRSADMHELDRLSPTEQAQMTRLCLGTRAPPDPVDEIVRRFSDGLPFLVEELLASAAPTGAGVVIPERFADLVARRLAQLPEDAARVLVEAAVLGPRFPTDVLPAVTGASVRTTTDALRRGVTAQLVVADPDNPRMFGFRHALTRDALLGQVLPFERLDVSRRALAALETYDPELSGSLCEVAAALAESIGDGAVAARLLLLAARRAAARGALSSAEQMLERAWDWAAGDEAAEVVIGRQLMEVLTDAGGIDRALEIGERLRAEPLPPADAAGVELDVARAAVAGSRWPVALSALGRARRTAPELGALADCVEAEVAYGRDQLEEAATLAASSLAVAESEGRPELACRALRVLGVCARFDGDLSGAERAFDRVVVISREHGLSTWRVRGTMERAALDVWHFRPATRVLAARAEAEAAGALVAAAHLDNYVAWMSRDRWDTDAADAAATRCASSARRFGLAPLVAMATTARACAAAQRGDREAMDLRIAEALAADPGNVDALAFVAAARATLALRRDDLVRAFAELDSCMGHLRRAPKSPTPERGLWALLCAVENRDPSGALAELAAGAGAMHAMNVAYRHYAEAVVLGRAGDAAAAGRHVALADGAGPPAWYQHHAHRVIAEPALVDGWGEPVGWLRAGLAYFEARGHDQIGAGCRALLTRAGAPVPRRARAGAVPADLAARGVTARELEVLELLGEAMATREIATRLFLSPKTVERHVANLVAKLDLAGRTALVAFAASRRS